LDCGDIQRWADHSDATALARVAGGQLVASNGRFARLEQGRGAWRWMNGPHARVRYQSLSELIVSESKTLAPAPYLSRFERNGQVVEVRLEKLPDGAMALIHDVTGEIRRQREAQREREALLHEERMHAMGVLASGVAHDLNHALNVIALRVATLRADPLFSPARRTLEALSNVVSDAAHIIARLQDLARRRRDRPTDPLDLAAVLTGALEMARTESDEADVRLEADVPPLPLVRGSAAEVAPVFGTLVRHAREHLPRGGVIRVRAREERGRVVVTFWYDGTGMSDEELATLFDPFTSAPSETSLGLSIAWGVMSRIGGSLSATSSSSEGTTYTLTFPLAAAAHKDRPPARSERSTQRVLIVDDEADNLDVLREVLELEGQHVTTARGGPEALVLFERGERFDLVLCDVGMPEMSGWHVAREIQRIAPGTRLYMLTGWAREISPSDPRLAFAQGVLPKPLDLDELRRVLTGTDQQHAPAAPMPAMH
jgi:signal transduction histidine kinase/ActR/RegA family two-component response regulator